MTGGDAASVREHVLSPEEYLSQIEFLDDDFEFQHKDGFEHVDTNFASQSYWKEAIARFKKNKGAMFSFVCILFLIVMALVGSSHEPVYLRSADYYQPEHGAESAGTGKYGYLRWF